MLPFHRQIVHPTVSPELEEMAALFALGALPPLERRAYLEHLGACAVCRQLTAQFTGVANQLSNTPEETAVPPRLKHRVLTQARAELAAREQRSPGETPSRRRGRAGWSWLGWLSPAPAAPMAIGMLAVAVAGLAAWNLDLQGNIKAQDRALVQQRQLLGAVAAGGAVSTLAGTQAAPGASGSLVQDPAGGRAFLVLTRLPSLPRDREFQVWRIKGTQPVGVGTFSPAGGAEQLVVVAEDFAGADAIGISIEPMGGSKAPTGPIVLLGDF